jgi:glucosamine--fructose-6-phosphate aminotransferase (isomerizing)
VFVLGRDMDYIIALESALKLKEISYIHAEAFPSGELKHGPIALLDESTAIIGITSNQNTDSSLRVNLKECEVRKAEIFTFSTSNVSKENDALIIDSTNINLNPLLIVIVTQLLSFYVAKLKGNDIDMPRNLAKSVTVE